MDLPQSERVDVTGLEELYATLVRHPPDAIGYFTLRRCLPKNRFEPIGRRNYNRADLAGYLEEEDDDPGAWTLDDPPDPLSLDGAAPQDPAIAESRALARAAVACILEVADQELGSDGDLTLKLEVWSPKGETLLYAPRLRVSAKNPRTEARAEEPAPVAPTLPLDPVVGTGIERGTWTELNRTIRDLLTTAQHAYGHSFQLIHRSAGASREAYTADMSQQRAVHEATVAQLRSVIEQQAGQLRDAFATIDKLIADTLGFKIDLAELGVGQHRTMEDRQVTADLQKRFIDQAGQLGQLWMASKTGILFDPELLDLLKVIQEDEALRRALKNPKLLVMLRNPALRAIFVQVLNDAAEAVVEPPPAEPTPQETPA